MGLLDTVRNAAAAAFETLGDLRTTVKLKRLDTTGYDPSAGPTPVYTVEQALAVLLDYKRSEIDGQNILPGDQRMLILSSVVSGPPAPNDRVEVGSVEWQVISVSKDPAKAAYDVQLRGLGE